MRPQWPRPSPYYGPQQDVDLLAGLGNGPSRDIPSAAQQEEATATEAEVPQLGTWAGRKRIFSEHLREESAAERQAAAEEGSCGGVVGGAGEQQRAGGAAAVALQRGKAAGASAAGTGLPPAGPSARPASPPQRIPSAQCSKPPARQQSAASNESNDSDLHAAWRWRFSRKWQQEQAKQFDPNYGREEEEDAFEAALNYMDAVEGLNLQIARTVSVGAASASDLQLERSGLSAMSPSLSQGMLLDSSVRDGQLLREEADASATNQLRAMARTAQEMLRHQREIERQVVERWSAAGAAGAGPGSTAGAGASAILAAVPAVSLDSWGRFSFVLVRITDRQGRQKMCVRGKNGYSDAAIQRQLEQEVATAAVAQRSPGARLELLGSGTMEWSRERDRLLKASVQAAQAGWLVPGGWALLIGKEEGGRVWRADMCLPALWRLLPPLLQVAGSRLVCANDVRLRTQADVGGLAAALARASLPVSFTVEHVARSSGA